MKVNKYSINSASCVFKHYKKTDGGGAHFDMPYTTV